MIKKINVLSLLLLSNFNSKLNSMQTSDLEDLENQSNNTEEIENIEKDLNSLQTSAIKDSGKIEQYLQTLNMPEEIIQLIIQKIIEPYINKIKNIDNIFKLYFIEIDQVEKDLRKELINLSLTSQSLKNSTSSAVDCAIKQIINIIKEKEKELKDDIIVKYKDLDIEILNNILKDILNKDYINRAILELATKLIIAVNNINLKNNWKNIILINASMKGYKDIIKLILDTGADINARDQDGWTALIWSIIEGHKDVTELLINRGADINTISLDSYAALIELAIQGHQDVVELISNYINTDIHLTNNYGWTPLIWAVIEGHKDIIEILLNRDADINAINKGGNTALMIAAFYGNKEIVELLLNYGADVNLRNKDGETALMLAEKRGHKDIVNLIESNMIKKNNFCLVS